MTAFTAMRAVRSHDFVVEKPLDQAFHLFEPEGERAWAKGWNPTYLSPPSGRTEAGMVFKTWHGGEGTIWMVVRHEPAAGLIEYVRMTPGSRVASVLVQCTSLDAHRTRVNVVYSFTGLTDAGNAYIKKMDEKSYRAYIESWGSAIAAMA